MRVYVNIHILCIGVCGEVSWSCVSSAMLCILRGSSSPTSALQRDITAALDSSKGHGPYHHPKRV